MIKAKRSDKASKRGCLFGQAGLDRCAHPPVPDSAAGAGGEHVQRDNIDGVVRRRLSVLCAID